MIRRLHIENFRCLRKVDINLEPLTVLVGANGSGKSSVCAVLAAPGFSEKDRWSRDAEAPVRVLLQTEAAKLRRSLLAHASMQQDSAWPSCQLLHLDLQALRAVNTLGEQRQLGIDGLGLANVFATLTRRTRDQVARKFCELVPMYADVDSRPVGSGQHRIVFQDRWHPTAWYEPAEVSDGSVLMLAFLMLQHQDPSPDLIAIEEPERGLHPFLMGELMKVLRQLASGDLGKRIQVLLATHSAELLEFVEPKEVRFLSRAKDTGETMVEEAPLDTPEWRKAFHEYDDSLGQLWLSGGLGGVPGS